MVNKNSREVYLDYLRAIAMIAVVFNHSWGYYSIDNRQIYMGEPIWYIDAVLNMLTRFNVPIFFMISGYLMLNTEKYASIKNAVRKGGGTRLMAQ